jgi:hypothetical protein
MVVLYNENGEIIGDVEYNNLLDYWDGRNWTNGGTGKHLGFGQFKGQFYLIYGTQWQGEQNRAEIVSAETIVKEAINSDNIKEIEDFPKLLEIYENEFNQKTIDEKSKVFSLRINLSESEEDVNKKIEKLKQKVSDFRNLKS